jgi:hypothetical protein
MNLSELCIRRPVFTTLITATFIVFGIFAYRLDRAPSPGNRLAEFRFGAAREFSE